MFDIALKEFEVDVGLLKGDIVDLYDMVGGFVLPIEIDANEHESVAIGFISCEAAYELDYDYEAAGLTYFIANILDDKSNESDDCTYNFGRFKIWLSR